MTRQFNGGQNRNQRQLNSMKNKTERHGKFVTTTQIALYRITVRICLPNWDNQTMEHIECNHKEPIASHFQHPVQQEKTH